MSSPTEEVGLHEAFDRVQDGAKLIDPDKCALALFVTRDGTVNLRSAYPDAQVAEILRTIADLAQARGVQL